MREATRNFLRVFLFIFLGLFSLPMLGFGGYLLVCWIRIHSPNLYYADYWYGTVALIWIGAGCISLWATFHGAWRRSFYGALFVVPVVLGLAAMVIIPDAQPKYSGLSADSNYLTDVNSRLRDWFENFHRFPTDESEFKRALSRRPVTESAYKQRGAAVPYQIVVTRNANGPKINDVSERPGVIYYCVSRDMQEFWVTMTGLETAVASTAHVARLAGSPSEKVRLIHATGNENAVEKP